MTLDHAEKIPLFQMIGKNVGIRRACGKFVLATNIDILFSNELMTFIKKKLKEGTLYRVDRLDVPERLPPAKSFDEILYFCSKNFFRINHIGGTTVVEKKSVFKKLFKIIKKPIFKEILNCFKWCWSKLGQILWKAVNTSSLYGFVRGLYTLFEEFVEFAAQVSFVIKRWIRRFICFVLPNNSTFVHSNACGDFTLLSYDNWIQLKGYPEWNIFSWHIDSILLYQARQHGIIEKDLARRLCIYHIEHEVGSGYSAEGAHALFNRLNSKGIPYITDKALKKLVSEMKSSQEKVVYNKDNWGMADFTFEEIVV
jgi:hypothetical protein